MGTPPILHFLSQQVPGWCMFPPCWSVWSPHIFSCVPQPPASAHSSGPQTSFASPASSLELCEPLIIRALSCLELSFPSHMYANQCTYFDFIISKWPSLELDFSDPHGIWEVVCNQLVLQQPPPQRRKGTLFPYSLVFVILFYFFAKNNLT